MASVARERLQQLRQRAELERRLVLSVERTDEHLVDLVNITTALPAGELKSSLDRLLDRVLTTRNMMARPFE